MARSMSKTKSAKMRKSHKKRHSKSHKKSLKHRKGRKTAKKHRKGKRKSKKAGRMMSMGNNNRFAYADMQFRKRQSAAEEQRRNEIAKRNREQMLAQKAQAEAKAAPSPESVTGQVNQAEMDML